jgi:hypothetical protein
MKKTALIVLLAAAALPAAQTRNQATTVVDPSLYQQVYYRPLSPVWSRGGRVTAVTGVASNPRLYYMGAAGGGVWRTSDAGARWEPLTDGATSTAPMLPTPICPSVSGSHRAPASDVRQTPPPAAPM